MTTREKPYECPDCGRHFTTEAHLATHRNAGHDRKAPKARRAPKATLATDLRKAFTLVGTVVEALGDPYCGRVLADRSGPLADALARLAVEDERIARWLGRMSAAGPYGALVVAGAEIAIPIAAHHGLLGAGWAELAGAPPVPVKEEKEDATPAPVE